MTRREFDVLVDRVVEDGLKPLLEMKGHDYAGDADALGSLRATAEQLGITPMQALLVYTKKHLDAIFTYAREGKLQSEPIETRRYDSMNYHLLAFALLVDEGVIKSPNLWDDPPRVEPACMDDYPEDQLPETD